MKMWQIVTIIGLILMLWFMMMSMFYKFLFAILGITSAVIATYLVLKIITPAVNYFNKKKEITRR